MSDSIPADQCTMFLVRHGATDLNLKVPTVLQGNGIDGPLAAIGREQAALTCTFLKSYAFDAVYASPMARAQETAGIIAPGRSIGIVPDIIEGNVGRWLGKNWDQIAAEDPEEYQKHLDDPAENPYPEGESAKDIARRSVPAITKLMQENLGRRILVVAHSIVIRVVLAHLYQIPLKSYRAIELDNCSVSRLHYHDEKLKVIVANSNFHLDPLSQ